MKRLTNKKALLMILFSAMIFIGCGKHNPQDFSLYGGTQPTSGPLGPYGPGGVQKYYPFFNYLPIKGLSEQNTGLYVNAGDQITLQASGLITITKNKCADWGYCYWNSSNNYKSIDELNITWTINGTVIANGSTIGVKASVDGYLRFGFDIDATKIIGAAGQMSITGLSVN